MAFPDPLEMPEELRIREKNFDISYYQQSSPAGMGFNQTIQRSIPMWYAEYETVGLRADRYDAVRSFFDLLDGSLGTFLAYDPRRPMPRAYSAQPTAEDPWTQTGQTAPRVTAVNVANSTISLDRLETGAVITKGDYISYKVGNIWVLHRSVETETVTGNTATIVVRPRPFVTTGFPVSIRYRKAVAQMKLLNTAEERDTVEGLPSFRFQAMQFIDRSV
jgi:hypothetical protein